MGQLNHFFSLRQNFKQVPGIPSTNCRRYSCFMCRRYSGFSFKYKLFPKPEYLQQLKKPLKAGNFWRDCNLVLMGGCYLRMAEVALALALNQSVRTDLTDNCIGSVRPVWSCADLCVQKCSSRPD